MDMMFQLWDEGGTGELGPAAFDRAAHQHPLLVPTHLLKVVTRAADKQLPLDPLHLTGVTAIDSMACVDVRWTITDGLV